MEAERLTGRLASVEWNTVPFQWFYATSVFTDEFYLEMVKRLPRIENYQRYGGPYKTRYLYKIKDNDVFWSGVKKLMEDFYGVSLRIQLCRDLPGYSIGPHTDSTREPATMLFYLAKDQTMQDHGTSIYLPKTRNFTSDGTVHHNRSDFDLHYTAPYVPNSVFGFVRSDNSFHGVEPTTAERDVLQVTVRG